MRQWWGRADADKAGGPDQDERSKVSERLNALLRVWNHLERRLDEAQRSLAWSAYERLAGNAAVLNPTLRPIDREWTMDEWARVSMEEERAEELARGAGGMQDGVSVGGGSQA